MQSQYTRGQGEFVCITCGTIVETRYASQARNRLYCSAACARGAQHRSVTTRPVERFLSYVEDSGVIPALCPERGTCWLWTGTLDDPDHEIAYGVFTVDSKQVTAHRFSWELANGPTPLLIIGRDGIEGKPFVCHYCGTSRCVRPEHLYLGTASDNMEDRERHGRTARGARSGRYTKPETTARGERSGSTKLTEASVIEIRKRSKHGEKRATLAREFGVTAPAISYIVLRQSWKHLPDPD